MEAESHTKADNDFKDNSYLDECIKAVIAAAYIQMDFKHLLGHFCAQ